MNKHSILLTAILFSPIVAEMPQLPQNDTANKRTEFKKNNSDTARIARIIAPVIIGGITGAITGRLCPHLPENPLIPFIAEHGLRYAFLAALHQACKAEDININMATLQISGELTALVFHTALKK